MAMRKPLGVTFVSMKKLFTIAIAFFSLISYSQDTIQKIVRLTNGKDTVVLNKFRKITIFRKSTLDSINENIQALDLSLSKTFLLIKPGRHELNIYQKNNTRKTIVTSDQTTTIRLKIPINEIEKIKRERIALKQTTLIVMLFSASSGLFFAPVLSNLSGQGGPYFSLPIYFSIVGSSLLTFSVALTINRIWGNHIYYTTTKTNKKKWTIN